MSIVDNLVYNKEDIQNHPEVLEYFKMLYRCEQRHKEVVTRSRNRILNLRYRAKDLEINYKKISDLTRLCKDWTNDEVYALVLRAVNNDPNYTKFKKFVYECMDTIRDIKTEKNKVKIQNSKDKREYGQKLRALGIKIGVITYAYAQSKAKAKFYIDNELNTKDNGLQDYKYLDSFVNVFAKHEIEKFREERAKPKTIPLEVLSSKGSSIITKDVMEFFVDEAFRVNKRLDAEKVSDRMLIENEVYKLFGLTPQQVKENTLKATA